MLHLRRKKSMDTLMKTPVRAVWIITFADLMCLLMGFFILLLSSSDLNKHKFDKIGSSMQSAFGFPSTRAANSPIIELSPLLQPISGNNTVLAKSISAQKTAAAISNKLHQQILDKKIEVFVEGEIIKIRMMDTSFFETGSTDIKNNFKKVLADIAQSLETTKGDIVITGYSDSVPIQNPIQRSNWELSADRASSVIREMMKDTKIPTNRFVLQSMGDSRPLKPNDTPENRAINRRVEITVMQKDEDDDASSHQEEPTVNQPMKNEQVEPAEQQPIEPSTNHEENDSDDLSVWKNPLNASDE
jgi:chemotaxis protein MotB